MINNFAILETLVPEVFDEDTFYYTEILDRSKKAGNNKGRRLHTYYHRTRAELREQEKQIIQQCHHFQARAYFRPSARSFKKVGQKFAAHLLDQAFAENWAGMRHGYSSCCGKSRIPSKKMWLFDFDFDIAHDPTPEFFKSLDTELSLWLVEEQGGLRVPSKKGFHILTKPFDRRLVDLCKEGVDIHYDNPTNLYIP